MVLLFVGKKKKGKEEGLVSRPGRGKKEWRGLSDCWTP